MQAETILPGQFKAIPIKHLTPSPLNHRKHFDAGKLQKLADSLNSQGQKQNLVVRPMKKADRYEIVVGERRWRAAAIAKKETLLCVVEDLTDSQVIEIQLVENTQRDDVHPLEEAEGYYALVTDHGYTVETIAERVSRDASTVYKRMKFRNLLPVLKKLWLDAKLVIGHAQQLCRLSEADQDRAIRGCLFMETNVRTDDGRGYERRKAVVAPKVLETWIKENILLVLNTAPWDKTDEALYVEAGPCSRCPKTTGANLTLFDDFAGAEERCTDSSCFKEKLNRYTHREIAFAEEAGTPLLRLVNNYGTAGPELKKLKAIDIHAAQIMTKKCGHLERAVIIKGPNEGHIVEICRNSKCTVRHPHLRGASSTVHHKPAKISPAEEKRRAKEQLDRRIEKKTTEHLIRSLVAKISHADLRAEEAELLIAVDFDNVGMDDEAFAELSRIVTGKSLVTEQPAARNYDGVFYARALLESVGDGSSPQSWQPDIVAAVTLRTLMASMLVNGGIPYGRDTREQQLNRLAMRRNVNVKEMKKWAKRDVAAEIKAEAKDLKAIALGAKKAVRRGMIKGRA